ncbi:MAG: hypothetical protein MSG64_08965 [Pyrinomonadaceae bacterium MAG19_C2-C3]|nr:hypothetical protein [Pyrinomonadaceae bacterium MAG19_C2-C3]
MKITANKLAAYILVAAFSIVMNFYGGEIFKSGTSYYNYLVGDEVVEHGSNVDSELAEFDVVSCDMGSPSFEFLMLLGLIVVLPPSLIMGVLVWLIQKRKGTNYQSPHNVPSLIWRK